MDRIETQQLLMLLPLFSVFIQNRLAQQMHPAPFPMLVLTYAILVYMRLFYDRGLIFIDWICLQMNLSLAFPWIPWIYSCQESWSRQLQGSLS